MDNPHNHHPDCHFKDSEHTFVSCGCQKIWEDYEDLKTDYEELKITSKENQSDG